MQRKISIADYRKDIYDYFHKSKECQSFFCASENETRYSGYYTSMYLIQDTSEALASHREKGFSDNSMEAYLEFWGIMQAIFIQQDAISELYLSVTNSNLETSSLEKWKEIRRVRNVCAGHPSRKDRPKSVPLTRTFMGRHFGDYNKLTYEQWQSPDQISFQNINLGLLIDEYSAEVLKVLETILVKMKEIN